MVGTEGEGFHETIKISIIMPHLSPKLSLNPDYAEPGWVGYNF